jgi:hypothetical protein
VLVDENGGSWWTPLFPNSFALDVFPSLRLRFPLFSALISYGFLFPSSNALNAPLAPVTFPVGLSRMPLGSLKKLQRAS